MSGNLLEGSCDLEVRVGAAVPPFKDEHRRTERAPPRRQPILRGEHFAVETFGVDYE